MVALATLKETFDWKLFYHQTLALSFNNGEKRISFTKLTVFFKQLIWALKTLHFESSMIKKPLLSALADLFLHIMRLTACG